MADKIQTLENLKKIAHHKVEEVQKELGETAAAIAHLADKATKKEQAIKHEEENMPDDLDMRAHFERFEKRARVEINTIQDEILTLRQHEAHLRDQLAEHFAEEKRYKILLERKQAELKKEREKKNQSQLDEIAAERHTQKH